MSTPILLIDDSPTMVMSLTRILQKAGYEVTSAVNGQEALDKLKAGLKPKLILTDLNMPVLDGLSFIREARKGGSTRFTPIVVLTTESGPAKEGEARQAGASGWLTKPAQPDELLGTLRRLVPA